METNTVETLIEYVKDLSGQTNAPTAKIIRALNFGVDDYSRQRILCSKRFTPDSTNHGNIARVTATLSSQKLSLTSLPELIGIRQVEVYVNGQYEVVEPIDIQDESESLDKVYGGTGTPKVYDVQSNHLYFYPSPSSGLTVRVTYTRNHPRFSADSLDDEVGVLNVDEEYIALFAADRIMIGTNDPSRTQIRQELEMKKKEMKQTFANLDQDKARRLTTRTGGTFSKNAFRLR
jgi:hypothetical protein